MTAQSRESKPIDDEPALFKMTESHNWFRDLDMSGVSDSDSKSKKAVRDQATSNPSVSPVLKATGRLEGRVMLTTAKGTEKCKPCNSRRGEVILPVTKDDQSVLKVAGGRSAKEKRSSQPNDLC